MNNQPQLPTTAELVPPGGVAPDPCAPIYPCENKIQQQQPEKILSEKEQNCYRKESKECVSYNDLTPVDQKKLQVGDRVFIKKQYFDNDGNSDSYFLLGKVTGVNAESSGRMVFHNYDIVLTDGSTKKKQYGNSLYLAKNKDDMSSDYLLFALGDSLKGGRKLKKGTTKKRKGTTKKRKGTTKKRMNKKN